jgi:chromosome segregation ATPase
MKKKDGASQFNVDELVSIHRQFIEKGNELENGMKSYVSGLEDAIKTTRVELEKLEVDKNAVVDKVTEQTNYLKDLELKIVCAKKELESIEGVKKQIDSLKAERDGLVSQIDALSSERKEMQDAIKEEALKKPAIENEIRECEERRDLLLQDVNEIEKTLASIRKQRDMEQDSCNNILDQIQQKNAKLEEVDAKIADKLLYQDELDKKEEDRKVDIEKLNQDYSHVEEEYRILLKKRETLEQVINNLKTEEKNHIESNTTLLKQIEENNKRAERQEESLRLRLQEVERVEKDLYLKKRRVEKLFGSKLET